MAKGKKGRSGAKRRAGTSAQQAQNSTTGIVIGVVVVVAIVGIVAFFISRSNSGAASSGSNGTDCKDGSGETITTPSGLKYQDLTICSGTPAKAGDKVAVHYTGSLENGTVFDSSFNHQPPEPYTFPLGQGQVIKGWDEGLLAMTVGSKRKLIIPPDLGYGAQGSPPTIPPNSTLIFTVQVMGISQ